MGILTLNPYNHNFTTENSNEGMSMRLLDNLNILVMIPTCRLTVRLNTGQVVEMLCKLGTEVGLRRGII